MQRAGAAAAAELSARLTATLDDGVVVATGPGNNGGDGWVVASALHAAGIRTRVVECTASRTDDARAERAHAIALGVVVSADVGALLTGGERIAVDALLGTGFHASSPLRGEVAAAAQALRAFRARGGQLVALDLPTGLDADSGVDVGALGVSLTLTFGTMKRGALVARGSCGTIVLLDIGLGTHVGASNGLALATASWFRESIPPIAADAHKGTRKKIALIGGAEGMAGAVILAARAALRSGAGLVKCVVAPESIRAVQEAEPAALAATWPIDDAAAAALADWADAVLIGPGLGRTHARALVERVLRAYRGPVVLDADALNAYEGEAAALRPLVGARQALLTPHPAELSRLAGVSVDDVLRRRFELPGHLAATTAAAVLLKGVPTVVTGPVHGGAAMVVAEGTPILATGGAGDVLGGIAATLLAQGGDAVQAGALAAFAHGRAATAVSANAVRGYLLDDVLRALPEVWSLCPPAPRAPVLVELPRVGEEVA